MIRFHHERRREQLGSPSTLAARDAFRADSPVTGLTRSRVTSARRARLLLVGVPLALLLSGVVAMVIDRLDASPVVRFVTAPGPDPNPLAIDAASGRAFIFNRSAGSVSVLDTVTGALIRTVTVGTGFAWLTVDRPAGRAYLSNGGDDTITTFDARRGTLLHQVTDDAANVRGLAVDERSGHVFVGHLGPTLTMLDARHGTILRHIPICNGSFAVVVSQHTGHVFAKCNDGTTTMLDARTGQILHTTQTLNQLWGGAVVDEPTDRVFEYSWDMGQIDVLDARTGRHLRTLPFGGDVAVDEQSGRAFVAPVPPGGPSGPLPRSEVVALDGWTGRVLRRVPVAAHPQTSAVDPLTGQVVVVSAGPVDAQGQPRGDGVLSVLDGRTLALLRTVPMGLNPTSVAVDARARRVLVGTETGDPYNTTIAGTVTTSPPEDGWHRLKRRVLAAVHHLLPPWSPLHVPVPPAPSPPTDGSVTTLDLTRL